MEHVSGRPRRAGVDAAVRAATASLVREQGYAGTTLDQIARAAGVAKTTVYRRWSSKAELAVEVLVDLLGDPPVPVHGEEVRAAVSWLAGRIGEPGVHQLLVGLIGEAVRDEGIRTALRERLRGPFEQRLVEAWGADPRRLDLAFDVVVGSLLHRAALAGAIDPGMIDAVSALAIDLLARPDA